jgi:hypothetical protein
MTLLRSSSLAFALAALLVGPGAAQEPPPAPALVAPTEQAPAEQAAPAPAGQAAPAPAGQAQQAFPTEQPEPANAAASTNEAEERGLTSEGVQGNQPAPPTDQGTLQPEIVEGEGSNEAPELYALLKAVRQAPAGLDGQPIPRPNPLASEPTTEMTPHQPEDPSLFPEGYVE